MMLTMFFLHARQVLQDLLQLYCINPVSYRCVLDVDAHALERPKEELTGLLTTMIDTNWRPWGEVGEEEGATW